jgi:uncharacterized membrane protein YciS (DUF1049 family)
LPYLEGMRVALRVLVLIVVAVGVGLATADGVVRHAVNAGAAESQIRLAGAMAGLFAGGAAAVVVGIGMALMGRRRG